MDRKTVRVGGDWASPLAKKNVIHEGRGKAETTEAGQRHESQIAKSGRRKLDPNMLDDLPDSCWDGVTESAYGK